MKAYLDIVRNVLENGEMKENRTGVRALTIPGAMFSHDMRNGFPLLTTKRVPFRLVASELEFFIGGITDKRWLEERGNRIWSNWASPERVKYGTDGETKSRMLNERDLGPIYGRQWRNFGGTYQNYWNGSDDGIDQLAALVRTLKSNPDDRRMIVSAWNPLDLHRMALPPCHYAFQVTVINGKLNLLWNQRSVDVALGLPFNIASYGLLLHLLALESGFEPGKLVGFLADTHIYENHLDGINEQLTREPMPLCSVATENFSGIFGWEYTDTKTVGYQSHPKIPFDIAV
jgi:thymidylate synthase